VKHGQIIYKNKFDILNIYNNINMDRLILTDDSNSILKNYDVRKNKTKNIMSKYERTKVIYERMLMLSSGSKSYLSNPEVHNGDLYEIVLDELKNDKIPFIIKRKIGNSYEYWKLEDLSKK